MKKKAPDNTFIGAELKSVRTSRGLSLAEVSEECKLHERFLKAIEEGHTDYLPTHIYFRMFARLYAETLEIDPDELIGRLYPEPPSPEFLQESGKTRLLDSTDGGSPSQEPAIQLAAKPRQAPIWNQHWKRESRSSGSSMGMNVAYALSGNRRLISRTLIGLASLTAIFFILKYSGIANGIAQDESPKVKPLVNDTNSFDQLGFETYVSGPLQLTARALKDVRLRLSSGRDELFMGALRKGESHTWSADYRFSLDVSDIESIEFYANGQRINLPADKDGRVAGFEVNKANYKELYVTNGLNAGR